MGLAYPGLRLYINFYIGHFGFRRHFLRGIFSFYANEMNCDNAYSHERLTMTFLRFSVIAAMLVMVVHVRGQSLPAGTYPAQDSLHAQLHDAESQAVLGPIVWQPGPFTVTVEKSAGLPFSEDVILSYPSPKPMHQPAEADTVYLEGFLAHQDDGRIIKAPALVIVPETDSRRLAARTLAAALRLQEVHVFVLQPPGYSRRNQNDIKHDPDQFLPRIRQTVADTRRARDAIGALPMMADQPAHIAGFSLGGFVATVTASLDDGYQQTFIMLSGGNLAQIITQGQKDAAAFKQRFINRGYTLAQLTDILRQVEPLRVAGRLNPSFTWLYTAKYDTVIPTECSDSLAAAIHLPADHRFVYPVDHYTSGIILPEVATHIADRIRRQTQGK